MMRSIVWFLLVLSLLFNVFFVFGYMKAQASSQLQNGDIAEANRVTEQVVNELKLNNTQREVFSKLRGEMRVFNAPTVCRASCSARATTGHSRAPWT